MEIIIDPKAPTLPTDRSWQFGLGADHAYQFHRRDVTEQLRFAHEELGFQRVRFHGIFDDDMYTLQDLKAFAPLPGRTAPVKELNFRQAADVYDNILSCGVEPFVELSFMPTPLASGKKTGLHYKNNTTPPANYGEWADYIGRFIHFLLDRYGKERVEQWYFEVWNEPDLGGFFSGTQQEYFRLYKTTAEAIKRADPALRVGGPSTSACKWIDEFLDYCRKSGAPVDFVSTHHYPGDAFGNLITPANYGAMAKIMFSACREKAPLGETMTRMFFHRSKAAKVPKGAVTSMDDELAAKTRGLPALITEWNSMAIYAAPVHDEKYSAAFVIKTVLDLNNELQGYMFWCLSDIFEELLQLNRPFFGGYGILTVDGIPKPNFWAFKMLSQLLPARLTCPFRTNEPVEYAAFTDGERVQVLVYAQSNDPDENNCFEADIRLGGLFSSASVQIIDDTHCNPKAEWQKLGCPDILSPGQVCAIKEATRLREEPCALQIEDDTTLLHCVLRTNDIRLYTLTK